MDLLQNYEEMMNHEIQELARIEAEILDRYERFPTMHKWELARLRTLRNNSRFSHRHIRNKYNKLICLMLGDALKVHRKEIASYLSEWHFV